MKKLALYIAVGMAVTTLVGCASGEPSTADMMRVHAKQAQARADLRQHFADDWDLGSALIRAGEKQVKKGEKKISAAETDLKAAESDLEGGREQVTQGNGKIADGQKLIQDSERLFRERFPELELKRAL